MIRKNQEFLNRLNQLGDILLVIGCYAFASWFWLVAKEGDATNMAMISGKSLLISLVYASAQSVLFMFLGFYSTTRTKRMSWKLGIIASGTTLLHCVSSL